MSKSVAEFLKTANEEEISSRNELFIKATRGVGLELLEISEWAKAIFGKYLSLELNLNAMLKEIKIAANNKADLKRLFDIGVICGRIEEYANAQIINDNDKNLVKLKDIPLLAKKYDFIFALATFLDDFKHTYDKYGFIKEEPPETNYLTKKDYCVLAAAAHKLANDNNLPTPEWIHNPKYILKKPYYVYKSKEAQQYLQKTSPIEFKIRNIFTTDNVLERV